MWINLKEYMLYKTIIAHGIKIYVQFKVMIIETLGQEGGVGKFALPPHTTTAQLQLNY